ncbi:FecCD family ABC transporter permease [Paenibacillus donghaensis]|uniref:Ferrichrome ABC transporter permease n=1 Tax=Paenibacillus donghaensis TaxID=414771 RepID=A0A2Z2KEE8_9BACL|nr:iron ABC transporter permease [Paenibacillus donghaensis]ASA20409.1 ferrichrome ABC transporter permease [Paenibacillus donghaensis]
MSTQREPTKKGMQNFAVFMMAGLVLLVLAVAASISFGAAQMNLKLAWGAVFQFDPALTEHQIIRTFRLPRTVADILVGCSLAVCGSVMQGTTRNPLADSGLIGISSGSTLAIALCMAYLPGRTYADTMLFSCLGAALATGITYYMASLGKNGMTPQRLILAGFSISMLFGAFSTFVAIKFKIGQALDYWTAGGTASAKWDELLYILPLFVLGVVWSLAISPSITILSFGDELAAGLGLRTRLVKISSTLIVLLLTGLSVIVVGPVGFVGLIVPHIVRYMVGVDYRYIIPASALYGAVILVAADIVGRLINRPHETPLGIIFAVIGVPYFLYLVRKQRREFM